MSCTDVLWNWRRIRIFISSLFLCTHISNINGNKCENIESSELKPMEDCSISLDSRYHLQVLCKIYYSREHVSVFTHEKRETILTMLGMESEQPVYNMSERICLFYKNFTIQKFLKSPKHNHIFPLLSPIGSIIGDIKEARIHLNFNEHNLTAVAQLSYNCKDSFQNFQNAFFDEIRNTSCQLSIIRISDIFFFINWSIVNLTTQSELLSVINQTKNTYLSKVVVTEIVIYFKESVIDTSFLSLLNSFNILKLEFPENNFRVIKNYEFPLIPTLEVLNMRESSTNFIEADVLNNFTKLRVVDFSKNKLQTIPEPFYSPKFVNLEYLNLEGNRPDKKNFSLSFHSSISYLKILRLSKIFIFQLDKGSFSSFPYLQILYLDNCNLTSLQEGIFDNLTSLFSLDLAVNNLNSLPSNIFASLYSLQHLNLSNNHFKQLPAQSISLALNLTNLNLQNNLIEDFSHFFHQNLRYLNLRNNRIKQFIVDSIDLSLLHSLDLSSNFISFFSKDVQYFLLNIDFVNISLNPFYCASCNLYFLQTLLNYTDYKDSNLFICSFPTEVSTKLVTSLNSTYEDCLNLVVDITKTVVVSVIGTLLSVLLISFIIYYYFWYFRYLFFQLKTMVWYFKPEKNTVQLCEYDAFIIYSDSERKWAEELVSYLESSESRLKICVHDRDFIAGNDIVKNIIETIDKSRKVIALLSDNFLKSDWCMQEIHLTKHMFTKKIRNDLILIKMEGFTDMSLVKHLRYLLRTMDFLEWPSEEHKRLLCLERLKNIIKSHRNSKKKDLEVIEYHTIC